MHLFKKSIYIIILVLFFTISISSFSLSNYINEGSSRDYIFHFENYYNDILRLDNDEEVIWRLQLLIKNPKYISYNKARHYLFSYVENFNSEINCIYTDLVVYDTKIPDHTIMNTEHVFPRSWFFGGEQNYMLSDLHALKPSWSRANSIRSNWPFDLIDKNGVILHDLDGSLLGENKFGERVFEPKDKSKGQIARIIFYWSVRYEWTIDERLEIIFREWNKKYPPCELEILRNSRVEDIIGTRNPFIDNLDIINKISRFKF